MQRQVIRHCPLRLDPDVLVGWHLLRVQQVIVFIDGPNVDRTRLREMLANSFGQLMGKPRAMLFFRLQVLRTNDLRHIELMFETRFRHLERRRHVEDLLAMLDGHNAPRREAFPVA